MLSFSIYFSRKWENIIVCFFLFVLLSLTFHIRASRLSSEGEVDNRGPVLGVRVCLCVLCMRDVLLLQAASVSK